LVLVSPAVVLYNCAWEARSGTCGVGLYTVWGEGDWDLGDLRGRFDRWAMGIRILRSHLDLDLGLQER